MSKNVGQNSLTRIRFILLARVEAVGQALKRLYGILTLAVTLAFAVALSLLLQNDMAAAFGSDTQVEALRGFLVQIGGALIGAATVAISLVMFAMQVNIERLPYGLFRSLSTDVRLLAGFAISYLAALAIAASSLLASPALASFFVLGAAWLTILIFAVFIYSYSRALGLISPTQQLDIILSRATEDLVRWGRRSQRSSPPPGWTDERPEPGDGNAFDHNRFLFFQRYPQWASYARQTVRHAIAFARRYSDAGDHEVAKRALDAIILINSAYISARGRTFFGTNLLVENPHTSDAFINSSLEAMRRYIARGIQISDEQIIEDGFSTIASLSQIYLSIPYPDHTQTKTHASLAVGYLSSGVQDVPIDKMTDVVLAGIRLLGRTAVNQVSVDDNLSAMGTIEAMSRILDRSLSSKNYFVVLQIAVAEIASAQLAIIRSGGNVLTPTKRIRQIVFGLAKIEIERQQTGPSLFYESPLGSFFSPALGNALPQQLRALSDAVMREPANSPDAQRVIRNFAEWCTDLAQDLAEITLLAIEFQSIFIMDVLQWVDNLIEILFFLQRTPAASEQDKQNLRDRAFELIRLLGRIPREQRAVTFLESFGVTEKLFTALHEARQANAPREADAAEFNLLRWGLEGGKSPSGWDVFEKSMYALAASALMDGAETCILLLTRLQTALGAGDAPDQERRDHAARIVRERAETLYREGHFGSEIEAAMQQVEQDQLRYMLWTIANLLSPATAAEPVRTWF